MEGQRRVPSLKTITFTDYWSMLLFLVPILFAVFAGGLVLTGKMDLAAVSSRLLAYPPSEWGREGIFLAITLLIIVLGPPLLALRIRKIRGVFKNGRETSGEVVFFRQFRDRGRLEFEFDHERETIRAANPVHLSRAVRAMHVGKTVTVVYLPETPKSAYIREIFQ